MTTGIDTFLEEYEVKLDYKKQDGYWICSHVESVHVELQYGDDEKNHHEAAKKIALERFPGCVIKTISLC